MWNRQKLLGGPFWVWVCWGGSGGPSPRGQKVGGADAEPCGGLRRGPPVPHPRGRAVLRTWACAGGGYLGGWVAPPTPGVLRCPHGTAQYHGDHPQGTRGGPQGTRGGVVVRVLVLVPNVRYNTQFRPYPFLQRGPSVQPQGPKQTTRLGLVQG